jgi:enterochelin esterase-like enzyme
MKKMLFLFLFGCFLSVSRAQVPTVSSGKLVQLDSFPSKFVHPHSVSVWLPEDYSPSRKYAVLYMHDGKALFDSTIMWNKQEWQVDETMGRLLAERKLQQTIVVGIWNGEARRHAEYFPQQPFYSLPQKVRDSLYQLKRFGEIPLFGDTVQSDSYLRFLVEELKPYVDSTFSTQSDRKHTFVAGSSMGGLISFYAMCEYPSVFGGAACFSTHWPGVFAVENNPVPEAFLKYLQKKLPDPRSHRLYFDFGDQTLDSLYAPFQAQVDVIVQAKKYKSKQWQTVFYPGEDHSERAWSKRFGTAMQFLLR